VIKAKFDSVQAREEGIKPSPKRHSVQPTIKRDKPGMNFFINQRQLLPQKFINLPSMPTQHSGRGAYKGLEERGYSNLDL